MITYETHPDKLQFTQEGRLGIIAIPSSSQKVTGKWMSADHSTRTRPFSEGVRGFFCTKLSSVLAEVGIIGAARKAATRGPARRWVISKVVSNFVMNKSLVGIICGLSAAAIWGGMYVVSKVVLDVIPPFTLVTLRLLLGAMTLWLIRINRDPKKTEPGQFWRVFGVGLVGYGISLGFQFVGTKLSTAANASLVTSATPAFILVFAWLILRERITKLRFAALLVATIGVVAVIDPRTAELNPTMFWGNLALVAAALTWALYSVLIRIVTRSLDILTVSLIAFLGGLPIVVPAGAWELSKGGIGPLNGGILAGVLFLGIISTALAMVSMEYGLCLSGCEHCLSDLLCAAGCRQPAGLVLSQGGDYCLFFFWEGF